MDGYDVVGDIHGHADALERLLHRLGYVLQDGVHRHPSRSMIFVGDFIDRGPQQRAVLQIARGMVNAGAALAVMGNHEFNAIAWATPDGRGGYLRPRTPKNHVQHREFLEQAGEGSEFHNQTLDWFRALPLWLDLGGLRVVHACWHASSQKALATCLDEHARLIDTGVDAVNDKSSAAFEAAEVILKGPEARLPNGCAFQDKDGHQRHEARLRWWDPAATTFRKAAIGMEGREHELPEARVPADYFYSDSTPVLFGHYWMPGQPRILQPRASCLDFSVAKGGYLTAYRWSGEASLRSENLVWVAA